MQSTILSTYDFYVCLAIVACFYIVFSFTFFWYFHLNVVWFFCCFKWNFIISHDCDFHMRKSYEEKSLPLYKSFIYLLIASYTYYLIKTETRLCTPSDIIKFVTVQQLTDDDCADSFDDVSERRGNLLENLLLLLNSASDLGIGPSITELRSRFDESVDTVNNAAALDNGFEFLYFTQLKFISLLQFFYHHHNCGNKRSFGPLLII